MAGLNKYITPALVLFLLSPAIAELLTGSTPPLLFFFPPLLAIDLALYGCGALVIRELAFRWKKGWPTILILGVAYGLIEEGLAVKSVYNPAYPGVDASIGRWMGINWIWTLGLVAFHAVISIAIPILLVTLIFPDKKDKLWASDRTLIILAIIMALDVLILNFAVAHYSPAAMLYVLTIAAIAVLVAIARLFPIRLRPYTVKLLRPRIFFIFGFIWLILYYLTVFIPSMLKPGIIPVVLVMLAFYALSAWVFMRMTGNGGSWNDSQKLTLAAGILGPYIILTPLREVLGARGSILVGITAAVFLYWLNRRVNRREEAMERTRSSPGS